MVFTETSAMFFFMKAHFSDWFPHNLNNESFQFSYLLILISSIDFKHRIIQQWNFRGLSFLKRYFCVHFLNQMTICTALSLAFY